LTARIVTAMVARSSSRDTDAKPVMLLIIARDARLKGSRSMSAADSRSMFAAL
jgi:hypothetical protein